MGGQLLALALALSQFGFVVAAALLLGFWLDQQLGTSPWIGLLGMILGFASALILLLKMVKSIRKGK